MRLTVKRRLSRGAAYAALAAVLLVVALAADWGRLADAFFRLDVAAEMFPGVVTDALLNTVIYTVLAFLFH